MGMWQQWFIPNTVIGIGGVKVGVFQNESIQHAVRRREAVLKKANKVPSNESMSKRRVQRSASGDV